MNKKVVCIDDNNLPPGAEIKEGSEYMVRPFSPEESYDANIAEDDVVDYKEV